MSSAVGRHEEETMEPQAADAVARVDAFHAAAIEAGGTDNGTPGVRAVYIEAVCHRPVSHAEVGSPT
jgi:hypothetical protein